MSKAFEIKPGIYDIPKLGKVNANNKVSDEKALAVYRLPRRVFPWITITEAALPLLKKQKFTAEEVSKMIQNAQSPEEVQLLASLSDTKVVERITETKLKGFENSKSN